MDVASVAAALRAEARAVNERRVLVLTGTRDACDDAARRVLDIVEGDASATAVVASRRILGRERVSPRHADQLLGTTREIVVFDAHDEFRPNALGRVVGAVDGGGLLLLLAPPLDSWPSQRDSFDATLTVPPFERNDVTGYFRRRFVDTLRDHRGIAIIDVNAGIVQADGLTHPAPRLSAADITRPDDHRFPAAAYEACLTQDQVDVVQALEAVADSGNAVVVEADRGRGKSSAAGLTAGALAASGDDVLVTAPEYRNAEELFVRAEALLVTLDELADSDHGQLTADSGGSIRFEKPADAATLPGNPDAVFVDEAAALPVHLLTQFLDADRVAFTTTVHGYEGAGRGFSVRFRSRLEDSDLQVTETRLDAPIRYAAGDPIEVWAFRALLLDARPAVDQVVADATPETATYRELSSQDLLVDEQLLREAFGLLVVAHYQTEPNDLARLLDAPNLFVRALTRHGHVVAVTLLAREGNLPADRRRDMYEGGRVRGNMLPDILTSQLRDEDAAGPSGIRVVRIATHHAVRSHGLGSHLLEQLHAEFASDVDWLGVGYGATPDLLSFWRANGYRTVHLSTTRNDTSGEHSAIMLAPTNDDGQTLHDRHARRFAGRIEGMLTDALDALDPDVVRIALAAVDAPIMLDLTDWEWRVVASSAYGNGMMDVTPRPFRRLALRYFVDAADLLSVHEERLLVRRVLQATDWNTVVDELEYHSTGQCMRAIGDAYQPLVDKYGGDTANAEKEKYD